jgi:hypothetical protein
MLEYCLGPVRGALAVGLVHYFTRSIFRTIESSMGWQDRA